ncbi:phage tail protein [Mesorhizobium sp. WSM3859]|uniref:phage tail protein n=1 Tax=Mesorhizobium sp. WSM3859 TaxID=2029402 RepID=UPI001140ED70|nr:phage tail protein [Mesorhizobium sp. WSM3859]
MTIELHADASDFEQLARGIARLPEQIKVKAASRAMRRVMQMARTRIVKRSAERVDLTQSRIRALTTVAMNAGGNSADIVMRSNWIALYKLGATQIATGVRVRMRGSYRSAFIAGMGSGHEGVFKRQGKARLPIHELFGPNPAHDITNHPEVFLQVLAEVIEDRLLPRYLHEVENLLPR